eukprot:3651208-Amphidinium_carterae.1
MAEQGSYASTQRSRQDIYAAAKLHPMMIPLAAMDVKSTVDSHRPQDLIKWTLRSNINWRPGRHQL